MTTASAWTPIGAVQVAGGGYDVAWHDTATGQYSVWSADSNGNYLSSIVGAVSGNDPALEAIETTFNQDLNGDGTIGVPPATKPAVTAAVSNVAAIALPGNDSFAFRQDLGANAGAANHIDPRSPASTNNQVANPAQLGLEQLLGVSETVHHDQAPNTGTHDQFLHDVHVANLLANQFHFH